MKKVLTVIYSILSLIFFTALLLFSGLAIFQVFQENHKLCTAQMKNIKEKCVTWQQGLWNDHDFKTTMDKSFTENSRLLSLAVYSQVKGILYGSSLKSPGQDTYLKNTIQSDRFSWDPGWTGQPLYRDRPILGSQTISIKIMSDPANDLQVQGLYQLLDYTELFNILKNGFIAVVIWLVVTIILRVSVGSGSQVNVTEPDAFPGLSDEIDDQPSATIVNKADSPGSVNLPVYTENSDEIEIPLSDTHEKPVDAYEDPPVNFNQDLTEFNQTEPDFPDTGSTLSEKPSGEAYSTVERDTVRNLFSPRTGIGWEAHLLPRLKMEIKRTASFDQDMSFALIYIDHHLKLNDLDGVIQDIARFIIELFLFQDLIFEYGDHGFAVVMPDVDISKAIREMEIFQHRITGRQIRGQFVTVSAGISSRNGRLVSGENLFKEAGRALGKAISDNRNSIIAFNPDPEKYREIVSKKT